MKFENLLEEIHTGCFTLCHNAIEKYLPVAGNMGVFCQSNDEFEAYTKMREEICHTSKDPNQKYFELKKSITINKIGNIPSATYTHLYIRRPNIESPEFGDVDFVLSQSEFSALKQRIISGEKITGASIYDRPGWDTIEIRNSEIKALAYISTQEMAEKVRVKF